jgi:hypothetical protein
LDDVDFSHPFFGPEEDQDLDFYARFFQDHEPSKLSIPDGMVHAWVGQKLLNCFIFKSFSLSVIAS